MDAEKKKELLVELMDEYAECDKCGLCERRTNVIFGEGNPDAKLLIVGEGPDGNDDEEGFPFCGPAGDMLDKFLRTFESSRDEVFILNVVMCWPTEEDDQNKTRAPTKEEIAACSERLHQAIEIVDPYVVLFLGGTAMKALTKGTPSISKVAREASIPSLTCITKGKTMDVERPALATFHPTYLLRNYNEKPQGDVMMSRRTWNKAFELLDMYNWLYDGIQPPSRGDE